MSFQGDVGGIGLAELLQSLSRGRREGLLRLHTKSGLACNLGLDSGVVAFLPDTDEDSVRWKDRARQAWIDDRDSCEEALRMSEIARASRIDRLYDILDSEEVHFRFESEESARAESKAEAGDTARMPEVHCEGMAVEYLLLEYARMADEASSQANFANLSAYTMPRLKSWAVEGEKAPKFLQQCDGASTLAEIADRMGSTMRQARLSFLTHLGRDELRPALSHEVLVAFQRELAHGHVLRASARLVSWIEIAPPGPMGEGDAALLLAEFKADRMSPLLNRMPTRAARTLLRRIDHAQADPAQQVKHWRELQRLRRHSPIVELHRLKSEFRSEAEPELPTLRELLDAARDMREGGHPGRAAPLLHMAASREPNKAHARMEIGLGLLAAGLVEEGAAWILDAAREQIENGTGEKVTSHLRTLVEVAPEIREARRLLSRLRSRSLRRQLIRKNSLVGIAVLCAMGAGAFVRVHTVRETEMQLAEIAALVQTPARASLLLETHFSGDESQAVQDLRERVKAGQELLDAEARNAWQQEYREAQGECSLGRAQDGLRLILDLPAPPRCVTQTEDWPLVSDLHGGLAARLEGELKSFGGIEATASESLAREEELARTVAALEQILANTEGRDDLHDLSERLADMASTLRTRVQDRARALSLRNSKETLAAQDLSLASARARAQAGDLERALEEYERLLASDPSGRIGELFAEEIADVQRRWQAISGARALALEGRHQEALEVLEAELEEAREQPLPWRLTSFPRGALVELPDGSRRATPFLLESRFGETVSLRIECEGCLSLDFELDAPADQHLWLSRTPERSWPGEGRIEALPVAVGEDHIVCDRTGELARLSAEGEELWKVDIASLGGIARAPVFLPRMPGRLLLVTEDGEAWVIDAEDGAIDGPVSLGSAPRSGPVATADGVQVLTREGKLATWTTRLKPSFSPATAADGEALRGSQSGLAARYRSGGVEGVFDSPWNGWRVEFLPEVLRVYKQDDPAGGFAVLRQADWTFLAWEAPHARLPEGRLWISGENGLAGYLP